MLRWRPEAHSLALAIYGLGLPKHTRVLSSCRISDRMQDSCRKWAAQNRLRLVPAHSFRSASVACIILMCVPIWFLLHAARAFLGGLQSPSAEHPELMI
jgi:hypothetical protein